MTPAELEHIVVVPANSVHGSERGVAADGAAPSAPALAAADAAAAAPPPVAAAPGAAPSTSSSFQSHPGASSEYAALREAQLVASGVALAEAAGARVRAALAAVHAAAAAAAAAAAGQAAPPDGSRSFRRRRHRAPAAEPAEVQPAVEALAEVLAHGLRQPAQRQQHERPVTVFEVLRAIDTRSRRTSNGARALANKRAARAARAALVPRAQVWVRASLSKRLLAQRMASICAAPAALEGWYEPGALLRQVADAMRPLLLADSEAWGSRSSRSSVGGAGAGAGSVAAGSANSSGAFALPLPVRELLAALSELDDVGGGVATLCPPAALSGRRKGCCERKQRHRQRPGAGRGGGGSDSDGSEELSPLSDPEDASSPGCLTGAQLWERAMAAEAALAAAGGGCGGGGGAGDEEGATVMRHGG